MASPLRLLREAGLIRHGLVAFAILTAVVNGIVTASVGAYLGHTYADFQTRRVSVQGLADLIYERRARAGLVASSLRRGSSVDELKERKRAYDDVYIDWNKRIQSNLLQIRDVLGAKEATGFETLIQGTLVPAFSEMDSCLTKAYDARLAGQDPVPLVEGCQFQSVYQFTLDCAKTLTDELFRVSRLTFNPFGGASIREIADGSQRAKDACSRAPTAKGI